ncbi:MAG: ATP-binding cassette domain-containing protein [bacterium]|nr:ATP-binding cassette domain-containing protein [bacterium]
MSGQKQTKSAKKGIQQKNEFKKLISFVMAQKTQLFLELPIQDTFDFFAEIYDIDKIKYKKLLNELLERFELQDKLETSGRRLSLGQRMKCELICSFLYEPKVIFLDEPTIGLDVNSAKEARKFLKESNTAQGTTIILTTHNMQDVEELCDRTIVINKGEKIHDGHTTDLKNYFGDSRVIEFLIDDLASDKIALLTKEITSRGGEIKYFQENNLKIKCERSQSAELITYILSSTSVKEINFHEEDLSNVISKIYKS